MDWFKFCKDYFNWGVADTDSLKIYVAKGKITTVQYKKITDLDYIASGS